MTTTSLKWQEPGPKKAALSGRWVEVVKELKRNPGKWALVAEGVSSNISTVLRRYGMEVTTRNNADNKCDVYARWVA